MKLVIQVPCLNEEATLPLVFADMPTAIPGIDEIEYLVIDDGCSDATVEVARRLGVRHFVHHTRTMGLGQSFQDGAMKALEMGADILVNTDGDNQYPSGRIPDLVTPILHGMADIVVADRQTHKIEHFSPVKKRLQKVGSRVVNIAASTELPDAASGFRAYSRESLIKLNLVTKFSYCMETIIQAGNKRLKITSIPVDTNPKTRESRLFRSTPEHVVRSAATILRAYVMYRPLTFFAWLGSLLFVAGIIPFIRYLVLVETNSHYGGPGRHLQSLVVGGVLVMGALITFSMGVIADLIRINRVMIEDGLILQKRMRFPVRGAVSDRETPIPL
ncbi:MAG TPA: glycosyltransferase family 2 protein [Acidimicrobiales bacterium]|jgi:glycosyltransferase involved in cell wall biosynthesis|nr:glycosyltransferase family 2 protein [Acidimicrobiales bacterium]